MFKHSTDYTEGHHGQSAGEVGDWFTRRHW